MAGAGFKTFASGEVLTAANVNTYLMQQTVMVFADSSARSTALGANVSEGMLSYLKDTNKVEVYDGSSWVASDDPNAIQNTIVDAKGDLISATAADTPARLAVGANDTVLTADSSTATGLKWATVASGAYTQLATGNLSGSSVSITSISGTYKDLLLTIESFYGSLDFDVKLRVNSSSANYRNFYNRIVDGTYGDGYGASDMFVVLEAIDNSDGDNYARIQFYDYANASIYKRATAEAYYLGSNTGRYTVSSEGLWRDVSAITSIQIDLDQGTWSGGTYTLYGVK